MSLLEELLVYITTQDRLGFLKFRQRVVKKYGYDKFKELLNKANKDLDGEIIQWVLRVLLLIRLIS